MTVEYLDRVGFSTESTGTGAVAVGNALAQMLTPTQAGAADGTSYLWLIQEGADWQLVEGVYTASGPSFSRDTTRISLIGGTVGTAGLNLGGNGVVRIVAGSADFARARDTGELYGSTQRNVTSTAVRDAIGATVLTIDGSNEVAVDLAEGQNFSLDADDDYTLLLPVNAIVGMSYEIEIINSAVVVPGFEAGHLGPDDALPDLPTVSGGSITLVCKVLAETAGTATTVHVVSGGGGWGDGT